MRPREIIETEEFLEAKAKVIEEIGESDHGFEDLRPVWDYVLARCPELYPRVLPSMSVRLLRTRPGYIPSLLIWYSHDEENEIVYLIDIRVASDGSEED